MGRVRCSVLFFLPGLIASITVCLSICIRRAAIQTHHPKFKGKFSPLTEGKSATMFYAILAYHEEEIVASWTKEEDAELMTELLAVNERLIRAKTLGASARLGPTGRAVTLRGKDAELVIDGPFAETKEQLLGFYIVDCPSLDDAVATARDLRRVNPTAVYEIREILLYRPGAPMTMSAESQN